MTERWLPVVGYEDCYEVSDQGRVKSVERQVPHKAGWYTVHERILKSSLTVHGYPRVGLRSLGVIKTYTIHRLVTRAFFGPLPLGQEVAHLDGDKTNSKVENLIYTTRKINHGHKKLHGTQTWGETHHLCTTLTEQDVEDIRVLYQLGTTQQRLAGEFGVSRQHVGGIVNQQRWANLP